MTKSQDNKPARCAGGFGRRTFLKSAAATGGALAVSSFPLVNIARAESNVIKIGVIDLLTGARSAFGEAGVWVEKQLTGLLKAGIKVGGKAYAIEPIIRDSQSDVNRTVSIANELVLKENVDLMLINDGLADPANEICDNNGTPAINFGQPMEPWHAARGSTPEKASLGRSCSCGRSPTCSAISSAVELSENQPQGRHLLRRQGRDRASGKCSPTLCRRNFTEVFGGMFRMETDDFSNQVDKWKTATPRSSPDWSSHPICPHCSARWGKRATSPK